MMRSTRWQVWILFVAATVAAAFAFGAWQRSTVPTMTLLKTATVLPEPMALPPFTLRDQHGDAFGARQLQGRWSLLFFGFANCGHVCPLTLQTLTAAVGDLDPAPRIVFLSVDPGRDTPAVLDRYVSGFGGDMIGITGDDSEIRKLAGALGVAYTVIPGPGPYVVEHSPAVFVLDPHARYRAIITSADDAAAIAADLLEIMDT